MSNLLTQISKLTRQLFPTGRAFGNKLNGVNEKLFTATDENISDLATDSRGVLDSILPDNDNFTTGDATRWEERLGMITNTAVSLSDRKLAIIRKMNHPGDIPARQSRDYLQDRLQAAGFDVYVYEDNGLTPAENFGILAAGIAEHATIVEHQTGMPHGDSGNGSVYEDTVANHIDEETDQYFYVGTNFTRTFMISGNPLSSEADVDVNRKDEFRQLILKLKPAKSVAFLNINYI
jgi:uncharacterized protein YmfQ (DUF2313 family)